MFLDEVVALKQSQLASLKRRLPLLKARPRCFPLRDFTAAVSKAGRLNLIAEIKKASPSKGIIQPKFHPGILAIQYSSFAQAISVLTEPRWFKGSVKYIVLAKEGSDAPILRKDFIIDELQIYESRYYEADAVLLIVRILTPQKLQSLLTLTHRLKMAALVEVHNLKELELALEAGAKIIGINNRNLDTMQVNLQTFFRLYPHIPKDKIIIAESGYQSRADLLPLAGKANAVLIGGSLMQAEDLELKLKSFTGIIKS
jgi:indole-3-glycerol phosphate synthase